MLPSVSCDPKDPQFYNDPYRWYQQRHATNPRFLWQEYGFDCYAALADVSAIFRDRRFGRRPGLPERRPEIERWYETERFSLLAMDPPDHTQMRGLVNRAFLSRRVEQLRPRIEELANELIDGFVDEGRVELLSDFAAPLPAIVIAEMIGLPAEMAPDLLGWSNRMVQMYMFGVDEQVEHDADVAAAEFTRYLRSVLDDRREHPADDLLTHMLTVEVDGERLSEAEVIATTILLLNAGHEATVHTTGNAVRAIIGWAHRTGTHPGELFATDEQTAATVEECLRFDPPLHMFTRYALEDAEIDGRTYERGDQIGLLLGAAAHDPTAVSDPAVFDPFRSDGAHVSFGAGIHFCIGAPLARIELQTSLSTLVRRLPNLDLAGTAPGYRDIYHFHGLERLDVVW